MRPIDIVAEVTREGISIRPALQYLGLQADLNLGIATFVNGTANSPVQIDTTQAATETIDYVVTDSQRRAAPFTPCR